jgi:hypothetical protein
MVAHLRTYWIREARALAQEAPASRGRASSRRALYGPDRAAAPRRNDALGGPCSGPRAALLHSELGVRAPIGQLHEIEESIRTPLVRRRFTITSPEEAFGKTRVISRMATSGRSITFDPLP